MWSGAAVDMQFQSYVWLVFEVEGWGLRLSLRLSLSFVVDWLSEGQGAGSVTSVEDLVCWVLK